MTNFKLAVFLSAVALALGGSAIATSIHVDPGGQDLPPGFGEEPCPACQAEQDLYEHLFAVHDVLVDEFFEDHAICDAVGEACLEIGPGAENQEVEVEIDGELVTVDCMEFMPLCGIAMHQWSQILAQSENDLNNAKASLAICKENNECPSGRAGQPDLTNLN